MIGRRTASRGASAKRLPPSLNVNLALPRACMRPPAQELAAIQLNYSAIGCGFRLSPQFRHSALARRDLDLVVPVDAVDDIGDRPGGDEHADDHVPEDAEIVAQRTNRAPKPAAVDEAQLSPDQIERLEAAYHYCNDDRNSGDGEIVIELADRLDEGPAISAEHKNAIGRIKQGHAGGKQSRKDQNRPDRKTLRRLGRRNAKKADLSRGVEAKAEQDAKRIHLPAALDQTKKAAEQAPEQPAIGEHQVEVFL